MRIGVVVPVHGFAPYLAEALDGVSAQGADEVVVVDDGSPEPLVLGAPHASATGLALVRRPSAGGPAVARAAGLDALGAVDAIALCDADDAWQPGHLAAMRDALEASGDVGWAFGRAIVVGPDGRETGETWERPVAGRHDAAALGRALYVANPVPTSSVVVRVAALEDAGGLVGPVRVAEDWELWLRLCARGSDAVCVDGPGIRYRRHPAGLTADVAGLARAQLTVHEAHRGLVPGDVAEAALCRDEAALAAGLARAGDGAGARAAWERVAARRPLTRGERVRAAALRVPGATVLAGRRDPYRR